MPPEDLQGNTSNGFYVIHRDLWSHPVFANAIQAAAFAWMIGQASWRPVTVRYKGCVIDLKRGELCVSIRDLSRRFGWGKSTGHHFLKKLENADMIRTLPGQGPGHLSICNYDKYQLSPDRDRTPPRPNPGQGPDTARTQNNKTNQVKEEKKESLYTSNFLRWYEHYPHKVGKADAAKAFNRAEKKVDIESLIAGVLRYVEMKPADRSWCNPSTWLNQERWSDEYGTVTERRSGHQTDADALAQAVHNLNSQEGRGCDVSANGSGDARSNLKLLGRDEGLDEAAKQ